MKYNKIITISAILFITALYLAGCGNKKLGDIDLDTGESGLYINGDTVSYGVNESFEKDYYDSDDIKAAVESEVEEFNNSSLASSSDAMSISTLKIKDKEAKFVFKFSTYDDYLNYIINYNRVSEDEIFLGTLNEANGQFSIESDFVNVSDGTDISYTSILENEDYNILIINETTKVQIEDGAAYMSDNCSVDENIITTPDGETGYIIFE